MNAMARMAASDNAAMNAAYGKGISRDLDKLMADLNGRLSAHDRKDMMVFVNDICKEAGVETSDVMSKRVEQPGVRIRQYCVWTLINEKFTPKQVVALFRFDRSCVAHSIKKVDSYLGTGA